MNTILVNCPVCNNQHSNQVDFCEKCEWEFIVIPGSASENLKKYYLEKLSRHKKIFETVKVVELLAPENGQLKKKVEELEAQIKNLAQLKNLNDDFEAYKSTHPDSVIVPVGATKGKAINVFWEQVSPLNFRFNCLDIETHFPKKIVLLLKKNSIPQGYGECDFTVLVETKSFKKISIQSAELAISPEFIKPGAYYIRFMNLNYNATNIQFIHNEQAPGNQETYVSKTLINIL